MELKELMRTLVHNEMEDISVYEVEADTFGGVPEHGETLRRFFLEQADQKRDRLKILRRVTKNDIGFRQRRTEPARSAQAALRIHTDKAAKNASLYTALARQLINPDFKQMVTEMSSAEYRAYETLKELQALFRK